ncbi:maintenance of telomere capping protein 1 [Pyronema domesticum]|uniref:Similar to Maintenance of telomere capping protein 1 acc. no. O94548 n=1 Tax=Pyronema omphalodes (strain CBS 100304) TaxID=1076935 RepID=U4LGN6_PYROM|nr:maintenance of telomere capping protein 1 [Pyronema domesticum]CCX30692.1 Similar to Maintenance of telomere capping protein 1; acc. no. O94548 [Pyronema omphalodes CBS 100304]
MSKSKHNDGLDDLFAGLPETVSTPPLKAPAAVDDPLADLDELESLAERPKPAALSRPETPRSAPKRSLSRSRTPGSGYGMPLSARNSLEQKRSEKAVTPPESPAKKDVAPASGGGWGWGSLWNTATTAVKAAEGLVQEIQQSEEGKKWVTQVKGNVDGLRGLAGEIKSTAIPTFSSLLNHLAPPIASHEQLRIHITHDLQNYPFVEAVVFGVFDRVMQQVEGGDLLIVQRGGASKPRSAEGTFGGGPWWKAMEKRELNACSGLQEGLKLAKAAAESYASEHAKAAAEEAASNSQNPTRKSNIFLSIQPTVHTMDALVASVTGESTGDEEKVVSFAIHLLDPEHEISFSTLSQSLPLQWLDWLNAPPPADAQQGQWALPEVIQDIMQIGGTDPREWVVEWVEETVGLSVGVVAQKYVAKRMRIGDAAEAGEEVRQATREQENAEGKAE